MTTSLKIGIAAACLLGVAGLIAKDIWTADKTAAVPATVALEKSAPAFLPPAVPADPAIGPAAEPVLCPSPELVAGKTAEASVKPSAPEATEPPRVYTVVQGDSLYAISNKIFGSPRHYERIYEANRDRIKDPGTLQVGINLRMPEIGAKTGAGVEKR